MRAAVVGGGAYVAGRSMGRRAEQQQQAESEQDQRISDLEQQQAPPAPQEQAPAAAATSPMIDQLNQLAALHQQGILSDDEFTAAKAKLFGT
ncbi:MAG TPA: SHOCT domain-containing protein [Streptosporangiaceae bacterium]|nr:SHOCT domain-containing protein [Streptosporangiaceae bacterium]